MTHGKYPAGFFVRVSIWKLPYKNWGAHQTMLGKSRVTSWDHPGYVSWLFRVYKYINHDKGIIYNWVYGLYTEYEIPFRVHKWLFLSNRGWNPTLFFDKDYNKINKPWNKDPVINQSV